MDTLKKHNNKKKNTNKNEKEKLPFSVFICPRTNIDELDDYKQVFTNIISDRIKEKYK